MNELLDLYALPYNEKEPIVCVDEKSLQLLDDARSPIPLKPGQGIRVDYQYKRKGTTNIFMGVEPKGGKRIATVSTRKTKQDYQIIYTIIFFNFRSIKTNTAGRMPEGFYNIYC